jgi:hypothetical protein
MSERICTKCGELKADSCFYESGGRSHSWCKSCEITLSGQRNERLRLDTRDIPTQYNGRQNADSVLKIRNTDLKNKTSCSIIRDHHEKLKDDPNHLSTKFIQKLVGRKCL